MQRGHAKNPCRPRAPRGQPVPPHYGPPSRFKEELSWAGSEAEGNLDGRQGPGDGRVELDQLGQGAREDGDDGGSLAGVAEVDAGIRRR